MSVCDGGVTGCELVTAGSGSGSGAPTMPPLSTDPERTVLRGIPPGVVGE